MTTPQTSALFEGFFDDAAVFPPGLAPLERAVRDHLARRATAVHPLTGPLILPLDAVAEAADLARAAGAGQGEEPPISLSIVSPAGGLEQALHAVDDVPEFRLHAIELKTEGSPDAWRAQLAEAAEAAAGPDAPDIYVELTADQVTDGALDTLGGTGLRLKFRTGGVRADLFPTTRQLAEVIHRAVVGGLELKFTAGLHQAVRFTNPDTGFTHHGFLNIAAAVLRARRGDDVESIVEVLESRDETAVAQEAAASPAWRETYLSFGTCDIPEPVESLQGLDMLDANLLADYRATLDGAAPGAAPTPED